jgi:hypothetical protein
MAKRLTDSEKWKDPWFKHLKCEMQLFWLFVLDTCDHAGIWKDQLDDFNCISGSPLDYEKIIINFEGRMIPLNDETFLIPKFVLFQYTNFNSEKNNAHKGVMRSLDSFGVTYEQVASFVRSEKTSFGNKINKNKPLVSPYKGSQDKEQEQDKVKVMVKEQDKGLEIKFDPKVFMSGMEDL